MKRATRYIASLLLAAGSYPVSLPAWSADGETSAALPSHHEEQRAAEHALTEGRHTFRFDTFGDEAFWGGTLRLRGFYHDGRFATLREVVDHYDLQFGLHLSEQEKTDLIEYLKSL